jgi:hypothetical protein
MSTFEWKEFNLDVWKIRCWKCHDGQIGILDYWELWRDKSHEFVSRSTPKRVCKSGEWVSSDKGTDELFNLRESKHDKVILDSFRVVHELERHLYSIFVSWVSS